MLSFATVAALRKKGSGSVAQLVEHGIEDPSVGGSNPSRATIVLNIGGAGQEGLWRLLNLNPGFKFQVLCVKALRDTASTLKK